MKNLKYYYIGLLSILMFSCSTPREKGENKTYGLWYNEGNFKQLLTVQYTWLGAVITVGGNYSTGTSTSSLKCDIDSKDDNTVKLKPKYDELPLMFGNWTFGSGSMMGGGFLYLEFSEDAETLVLSDDAGKSVTLTLNYKENTTSSNVNSKIQSSESSTIPDTIFTEFEYEKIDYSNADWKELTNIEFEKGEQINKMIDECKSLRLGPNEVSDLPNKLMIQYNEYFVILEEMIKRPNLYKTENNLLFTLKDYYVYKNNQNKALKIFQESAREQGKKVEFIIHPTLNLDKVVEGLQNKNTKYIGFTGEQIAEKF